MSEPTPRSYQIFLEVFETLPRQGPGNRTCAAEALALCRDLPPAPAVIDLGCGVGGQTLHLAELTLGTIVAVDSHAPSIERLRATAAERGLSQRILPVVGDMANLEQPPASFDLVWSEGAFYNISALRNSAAATRTTKKPSPYLTSWRRSPRCTSGTRTTTPTSSSWRAA